MRCILHIGLEKTGTTAIQSYLHANREPFARKRHHVLSSLGIAQHRPLVSCAMRNDAFDDLHKAYGISTKGDKYKFDTNILKRIDKEIRRLGDSELAVIISSEHFTSRLKTYQEIVRLKNILDMWFSEYSLLIYLRPQIERAVSLYSTALKFGLAMDLNEFIDFQLESRAHDYDYFEICEKWAGVFGSDALIVRSYNNAMLYGGGVVEDFISALEIDIPLGADLGSPNQSLSAFGQDLLVLLNRLNKDQAGVVGQKIADARHFVIQTCKGEGQRVEKKDKDRLQRKFSESNRRLASTWLPGWKAEAEDLRSFERSIAPSCLTHADKAALSKIFEFLVS